MNNKEIIVTLTFLCVILFFFSGFLFVRGGYSDKLLNNLGLGKKKNEINWAVQAWTNCIEQLGVNADIVFFGDSITYGGNWASFFPEKLVVNFGYPGDSLYGMRERVDQLNAVNPEKVFIMGGINGLKHFGIEKTIEQYTKLIIDIKEKMPRTEIYVESLLPIAKKKERNYGTNEQIEELNMKLNELSKEKGITFVDLWRLYEENGILKEEYSKDGIHLKEGAYIYWVEEISKYME